MLIPAYEWRRDLERVLVGTGCADKHAVVSKRIDHIQRILRRAAALISFEPISTPKNTPACRTSRMTGDVAAMVSSSFNFRYMLPRLPGSGMWPLGRGALVVSFIVRKSSKRMNHIQFQYKRLLVESSYPFKAIRSHANCKEDMLFDADADRPD